MGGEKTQLLETLCPKAALGHKEWGVTGLETVCFFLVWILS